MSYMTTVAIQTTALLEGPKLRLLPRKGSRSRPSRNPEASVGHRTLRLFSEPKPEVQPVLVAGGDSAGRAAVLRDLAGSMPASTTFEQASAVWEVLVRAPGSSMVILSGELGEVSTESLMQMLAHRNPSLPVVSIDSDSDALVSPKQIQ